MKSPEEKYIEAEEKPGKEMAEYEKTDEESTDANENKEK